MCGDATGATGGLDFFPGGASFDGACFKAGSDSEVNPPCPAASIGAGRNAIILNSVISSAALGSGAIGRSRLPLIAN